MGVIGCCGPQAARCTIRQLAVINVDSVSAFRPPKPAFCMLLIGKRRHDRGIIRFPYGKWRNWRCHQFDSDGKVMLPKNDLNARQDNVHYLSSILYLQKRKCNVGVAWVERRRLLHYTAPVLSGPAFMTDSSHKSSATATHPSSSLTAEQQQQSANHTPRMPTSTFLCNSNSRTLSPAGSDGCT